MQVEEEARMRDQLVKQTEEKRIAEIGTRSSLLYRYY